MLHFFTVVFFHLVSQTVLKTGLFVKFGLQFLYFLFQKLLISNQRFPFLDDKIVLIGFSVNLLCYSSKLFDNKWLKIFEWDFGIILKV